MTCGECKTVTYVCNKCNKGDCKKHKNACCVATMPKYCVVFNVPCFCGEFTPDWKLKEESEECNG